MKTVYRIVCPIFCALVFPIFYFLPLIRIFISSSLSENIMATIGLKENMSLKYLISAFGDNESQSGIFKAIIESIKDKDSTLGKMFTNTGYLKAAAVFLILALVIVLVTIIVTAATKKTGLSIGLTLGAMFSFIVANKLFNAFAEPMLSGKIGIGSLITSAAGSNESAGVLGGLLGSVFQLKVLELGWAYPVTLLVLGISVIIGICAVFEQKYAK